MKNNTSYINAIIIVIGLFFYGCGAAENTQVAYLDSEHPDSGTFEKSDITDHTYNENMYFFFLPPLVPHFESFGDFISSLHPEVDVINLSNGAAIAEYSMLTGPNSETVHIVPEEQCYLVNWYVELHKLDRRAIYRVRVRAGRDRTEFGHIDIKVIGTEKDLLNINTNTFVPLLDGNVVPIKFRLERGL